MSLLPATDLQVGGTILFAAWQTMGQRASWARWRRPTDG